MEDFGSWSVLTTNFLIILYIALGGVTLSSVLHLCNGKWRFQVRKLACSFAALFPIAGVLLLILLANGEATFPWMLHAHDEGVHLSGWHNYTFLVTREILGFIAIATLYGLFIKYQHLSDVDKSYKAQRRYRNIALLIPFAYFAYGSMVAWDFEMTLIPGWHSASYGVYHFQSGFHMFLAVFTIFLYFIYRSGKLVETFQPYIFNYMAQFMLAMTILWTYFYFTQYLIMWYARLPMEMQRFDMMMLEGFGALWWTFLALKFVFPFLTLIFTGNRHSPTVITMVAFSIVLGSWIERYTWIAGSVDSQYYHYPMTSMFDIVVTLAIFGAAWWGMQKTLDRFGLVRGDS